MFFAVLTAAIWGIGRIARSRGEMAAELEVRTAELREARDERARSRWQPTGQGCPRSSTSCSSAGSASWRELADAGPAPDDAEAATARLAEIESKSRRTLDEMRAVVGVLRNARR